MTFDLAKTIEEDTTEIPEASLERAVQMGELMDAADAEVTRLTEELKTAKTRYNDIALESLPQLLKELGLESIKLKSGVKIEVIGGLSCSITKAKHETAMKWLTDNDFGGIIKTQVIVAFPREEQEDAEEFAARAAEEHDGVTYKAAVHPATLKSFVKEQLEAGTKLPLELFSVYEYDVAKLTRPRSK